MTPEPTVFANAIHSIEIFVHKAFSMKVEWRPSRKEARMAKTMESSSLTEKPRIARSHATQHEIALRAYHIYLERGCAAGNELEDWIEAERQLVGENSKIGENGNGKTRRKPKVNSAAA